MWKTQLLWMESVKPVQITHVCDQHVTFSLKIMEDLLVIIMANTLWCMDQKCIIEFWKLKNVCVKLQLDSERQL